MTSPGNDGDPGPSAARVAVEPPGPGHERLRLLLAYDGAGFRGFAENRGVRTVGGELRAALERVVGVPLVLAVAGRTDAGVHAQGQVVSVDVPVGSADPADLRRALNSLLAPQVVAREVTFAPADFHARFSARWRRYRYRLLATEVPDPFLAGTTWWVPAVLDRHRMAAAAHELVGTHDFAAFCRRPRDRPEASLVREVTDARFSQEPREDGRILTFEITAGAFCHQMVRSIVGTLVEVGRGRRPVSSVPEALAGSDRALAGQLAPPQGLVLWEVGY